MKWIVVEFRENSGKSGNVDVYYNAVPESWIIFGKKIFVNWSGSFSCSKDIMLGLPPKAPTKLYPCKLISEKFDNYDAAKEAEISIFNEKKNKGDLTTEIDSDEEQSAKTTATDSDCNALAEKLLNLEKNKVTLSHNHEDSESQKKSKHANPVTISNVTLLTASENTGENTNSEIEPTLQAVQSLQDNSSESMHTFGNNVYSSFDIDNAQILLPKCTCSDAIIDSLKQLLKISLNNQTLLKNLSNKQDLKYIHVDQAKKILENHDIHLPLTDVEHLESLNALLQHDKQIKDAIVSIYCRKIAFTYETKILFLQGIYFFQRNF